MADLHLLLHARRLLLTCAIVCALVFAAYSGVLVALGRQRDWLLLLFIPLGLSGVGVGALLDRAHAGRSAAGSAGHAEVPDGLPDQKADVTD